MYQSSSIFYLKKTYHIFQRGKLNREKQTKAEFYSDPLSLTHTHTHTHREHDLESSDNGAVD